MSFNTRVFLEAYISVGGLAVMLAVAVFIRRYADHSQMETHCYVTLFVAYVAAVGIVLLCPPDLALTLDGRNHPDQDHQDAFRKYSQNELLYFYMTCYWCCFALNSILQFQELYMVSGAFTIGTRLIDTCKKISKMAAAGLVAFLIFLGVISQSNHFKGTDALKVTLMSLANAYGLFVIVFLLGYGLVEFPKFLFKFGDDKGRRNQMRARIALAISAQESTSLRMTSAIASAQKTRDYLDKNGDIDMQDAIGIVLKHCPSERVAKNSNLGEIAKDKKGNVNMGSIAALHSNIIKGVANYQAAQGRIERLKEQYWLLSDICNSAEREDGVEKIKWSFGRTDSTHWEWVWHCRVKIWFFRFLSIAAAVMSATIVFGELGMMTGKPSPMSAWATAVHGKDLHTFGIMLYTFIPVSYEIFICCWALMQMRIAGMMVLVPFNKTSPKSLSFAARRLVGMAPPLVYNHLGMVFESTFFLAEQDDDAVTRFPSAFATLYGEMDTSAVGDFNTFFPGLMLVIMLLQAGNLFNRLFVCLKCPSAQFGDETADEKMLKKADQRLVKEHERIERSVSRDIKRDQMVKSKSRDKSRRKSILEIATDVVEQRPSPAQQFAGQAPDKRAGWMEKKAPKRKSTQTWARRYFQIEEPGVLEYYKKDDVSGEPQGVVDLRLVMSIKLHSHSRSGGKDATRIDVDLADRTFKLRCTDAEEAQGWLDALLEWRDHSVDHAALHPTIHHDGDDDGHEEDEVYGDSKRLSNLSNSSSSPASSPGRKHGRSKTNSSGGDATEMEMAPTVSTSADTNAARKASILNTTKPPPLSGMLLKKATGKHSFRGVRDQWQPRYFEVYPDATLRYFKKQGDATPKGSVDLRMVIDVGAHVGSKDHGDVKDPTRFDVDLGDSGKILRMKATSEDEAGHWTEALLAWRDYFLMNSASASMGVLAVDPGGSDELV